MLAALLAHALPGVAVESAGTAAAPGEPASFGAQTAMRRRGLDLSAHRSRPLDRLDLMAYGHLLAVSSRHAAHLRSLGVPTERISVVAAERGGVPDPWGGDEEDYEAVAKLLEAEAARLAATLSRPG